VRASYRVFLPTAVAVILGLIGWWGLGSPEAPAQERPHPIRWEYKLIGYHPVLENMQKELDKAGADGWEVCAATSGPVQHVVMKRPRR
jgi:hypothetical protein